MKKKLQMRRPGCLTAYPAIFKHLQKRFEMIFSPNYFVGGGFFRHFVLVEVPLTRNKFSVSRLEPPIRFRAWQAEMKVTDRTRPFGATLEFLCPLV